MLNTSTADDSPLPKATFKTTSNNKNKSIIPKEEDSFEIPEEKHQNNNENNFIKSKRHKYAMYSTKIKEKCIEMCKNEEAKIVAKKLAVPFKSLKRWLEVGPERKKGGGRKIRDPEMEEKIFSWYKQVKLENNLPVTAKMIKQKALEITKFRDFIASKGWLEKFKKKYKLDLNRSKKVKEISIN